MKDLTGPEFARRASEALGGRGWQVRLSVAIDVNISTIRRWTSEAIPVPKYACAVLELLEATPPAFRPPRWLKRAVASASRE